MSTFWGNSIKLVYLMSKLIQNPHFTKLILISWCSTSNRSSFNTLLCHFQEFVKSSSKTASMSNICTCHSTFLHWVLTFMFSITFTTKKHHMNILECCIHVIIDRYHNLYQMNALSLLVRHFISQLETQNCNSICILLQKLHTGW